MATLASILERVRESACRCRGVGRSLLLEALGGPQRGQRRRRRLARARGMLRQRVPAQVQRRLEAAAAGGARHRLRLVDQPHVLAQVGRVAVPPPAHPALHPAADRAARRSARCQQHHVRTAPATAEPPASTPPPRPSSNAIRVRDANRYPRNVQILILIQLINTHSGGNSRW